MNYPTLTITLSKGRKGTFIGKIIELPHIIVRGTSPTEVRAKIVEAIQNYQKPMAS